MGFITVLVQASDWPLPETRSKAEIELALIEEMKSKLDDGLGDIEPIVNMLVEISDGNHDVFKDEQTFKNSVILLLSQVEKKRIIAEWVYTLARKGVSADKLLSKTLTDAEKLDFSVQSPFYDTLSVIGRLHRRLKLCYSIIPAKDIKKEGCDEVDIDINKLAPDTEQTLEPSAKELLGKKELLARMGKTIKSVIRSSQGEIVTSIYPSSSLANLTSKAIDELDLVFNNYENEAKIIDVLEALEQFSEEYEKGIQLYYHKLLASQETIQKLLSSSTLPSWAQLKVNEWAPEKIQTEDLNSFIKDWCSHAGIKIPPTSETKNCAGLIENHRSMESYSNVLKKRLYNYRSVTWRLTQLAKISDGSVNFNISTNPDALKIKNEWGTALQSVYSVLSSRSRELVLLQKAAALQKKVPCELLVDSFGKDQKEQKEEICQTQLTILNELGELQKVNTNGAQSVETFKNDVSLIFYQTQKNNQNPFFEMAVTTLVNGLLGEHKDPFESLGSYILELPERKKILSFLRVDEKLIKRITASDTTRLNKVKEISKLLGEVTNEQQLKEELTRSSATIQAALKLLSDEHPVPSVNHLEVKPIFKINTLTTSGDEVSADVELLFVRGLTQDLKDKGWQQPKISTGVHYKVTIDIKDKKIRELITNGNLGSWIYTQVKNTKKELEKNTSEFAQLLKEQGFDLSMIDEFKEFVLDKGILVETIAGPVLLTFFSNCSDSTSESKDKCFKISDPKDLSKVVQSFAYELISKRSENIIKELKGKYELLSEPLIEDIRKKFETFLDANNVMVKDGIITAIADFGAISNALTGQKIKIISGIASTDKIRITGDIDYDKLVMAFLDKLDFLHYQFEEKHWQVHLKTLTNSMFAMNGLRQEKSLTLNSTSTMFLAPSFSLKNITATLDFSEPLFSLKGALTTPHWTEPIEVDISIKKTDSGTKWLLDSNKNEDLFQSIQSAYRMNGLYFSSFPTMTSAYFDTKGLHIEFDKAGDTLDKANEALKAGLIDSIRTIGANWKESLNQELKSRFKDYEKKLTSLAGASLWAHVISPTNVSNNKVTCDDDVTDSCVLKKESAFGDFEVDCKDDDVDDGYYKSCSLKLSLSKELIGCDDVLEFIFDFDAENKKYVRSTSSGGGYKTECLLDALRKVIPGNLVTSNDVAIYPRTVDLIDKHLVIPIKINQMHGLPGEPKVKVDSVINLYLSGDGAELDTQAFEASIKDIAQSKAKKILKAKLTKLFEMLGTNVTDFILKKKPDDLKICDAQKNNGYNKIKGRVESELLSFSTLNLKLEKLCIPYEYKFGVWLPMGIEFSIAKNEKDKDGNDIKVIGIENLKVVLDGDRVKINTSDIRFNTDIKAKINEVIQARLSKKEYLNLTVDHIIGKDSDIRVYMTALLKMGELTGEQGIATKIDISLLKFDTNFKLGDSLKPIILGILATQFEKVIKDFTYDGDISISFSKVDPKNIHEPNNNDELYITGNMLFPDAYGINKDFYVTVPVFGGGFKMHSEIPSLDSLLDPLGKQLQIDLFGFKVKNPKWDNPKWVKQGKLPKSVKFEVYGKVAEFIEARLPDLYVNSKGIHFGKFTAINLKLKGGALLPSTPPLSLTDIGGSLDKEKLVLSGRLTIGTPDIASVSALLFYAKGQFTVNLKKPGIFTFDTRNAILMFIKGGSTKSELDLRKGIIKTSIDATGNLSKFLDIKGDVKLDVKNKRIDGEVKAKALNLDLGKGILNIDLEAGEVNFKSVVDLVLFTEIAELKTQRGFRTPEITSRHDFKIGKFILSGSSLTISKSATSYEFRVLGTDFGVVTPSIYDLSKDRILKMILAMLSPDLKNIDEGLKQLLKGNFRINPMSNFGPGSSGVGEDNSGSKGSNNQSGQDGQDGQGAQGEMGDLNNSASDNRAAIEQTIKEKEAAATGDVEKNGKNKSAHEEAKFMAKGSFTFPIMKINADDTHAQVFVENATLGDASRQTVTKVRITDGHFSCRAEACYSNGEILYVGSDYFVHSLKQSDKAIVYWHKGQEKVEVNHFNLAELEPFKFAGNNAQVSNGVKKLLTKELLRGSSLWMNSTAGAFIESTTWLQSNNGIKALAVKYYAASNYVFYLINDKDNKSDHKARIVEFDEFNKRKSDSAFISALLERLWKNEEKLSVISADDRLFVMDTELTLWDDNEFKTIQHQLTPSESSSNEVEEALNKYKEQLKYEKELKEEFEKEAKKATDQDNESVKLLNLLNLNIGTGSGVNVVNPPKDGGKVTIEINSPLKMYNGSSGSVSDLYVHLVEGQGETNKEENIYEIDGHPVFEKQGDKWALMPGPVYFSVSTQYGLRYILTGSKSICDSVAYWLGVNKAILKLPFNDIELCKNNTAVIEPERLKLFRQLLDTVAKYRPKYNKNTAIVPIATHHFWSDEKSKYSYIAAKVGQKIFVVAGSKKGLVFDFEIKGDVTWDALKNNNWAINGIIEQVFKHDENDDKEVILIDATPTKKSLISIVDEHVVLHKENQQSDKTFTTLLKENRGSNVRQELAQASDSAYKRLLIESIGSTDIFESNNSLFYHKTVYGNIGQEVLEVSGDKLLSSDLVRLKYAEGTIQTEKYLKSNWKNSRPNASYVREFVSDSCEKADQSKTINLAYIFESLIGEEQLEPLRNFPCHPVEYLIHRVNNHIAVGVWPAGELYIRFFQVEWYERNKSRLKLEIAGKVTGHKAYVQLKPITQDKFNFLRQKGPTAVSYFLNQKLKDNFDSDIFQIDDKLVLVEKEWQTFHVYSDVNKTFKTLSLNQPLSNVTDESLRNGLLSYLVNKNILGNSQIRYEEKDNAILIKQSDKLDLLTLQGDRYHLTSLTSFGSVSDSSSYYRSFIKGLVDTTQTHTIDLLATNKTNNAYLVQTDRKLYLADDKHVQALELSDDLYPEKKQNQCFYTDLIKQYANYKKTIPESDKAFSMTYKRISVKVANVDKKFSAVTYGQNNKEKVLFLYPADTNAQCDNYKITTPDNFKLSRRHLKEIIPKMVGGNLNAKGTAYRSDVYFEFKNAGSSDNRMSYLIVHDKNRCTDSTSGEYFSKELNNTFVKSVIDDHHWVNDVTNKKGNCRYTVPTDIIAPDKSVFNTLTIAKYYDQPNIYSVLRRKPVSHIQLPVSHIQLPETQFDIPIDFLQAYADSRFRDNKASAKRFIKSPIKSGNNSESYAYTVLTYENENRVVTVETWRPSGNVTVNSMTKPHSLQVGKLDQKTTDKLLDSYLKNITTDFEANLKLIKNIPVAEKYIAWLSSKPIVTKDKVETINKLCKSKLVHLVSTGWQSSFCTNISLALVQQSQDLLTQIFDNLEGSKYDKQTSTFYLLDQEKMAVHANNSTQVFCLNNKNTVLKYSGIYPEELLSSKKFLSELNCSQEAFELFSSDNNKVYLLKSSDSIASVYDSRNFGVPVIITNYSADWTRLDIKMLLNYFSENKKLYLQKAAYYLEDDTAGYYATSDTLLKLKGKVIEIGKNIGGIVKEKTALTKAIGNRKNEFICHIEQVSGKHFFIKTWEKGGGECEKYKLAILNDGGTIKSKDFPVYNPEDVDPPTIGKVLTKYWLDKNKAELTEIFSTNCPAENIKGYINKTVLVDTNIKYFPIIDDKFGSVDFGGGNDKEMINCSLFFLKSLPIDSAEPFMWEQKTNGSIHIREHDEDSWFVWSQIKTYNKSPTIKIIKKASFWTGCKTVRECVSDLPSNLGPEIYTILQVCSGNEDSCNVSKIGSGVR